MWLAAVAGLILYVGFTIHLCLLALAYPYQLDYGEGLVLYQAQLLAQGKSIYKMLDSFPYVFSNYPPLMQAVVSPVIALLGPSFLPGRALGVISTFGLALVLYALVRRAGAGAFAAIVAAMLFVGSPYIYHWAPLFRIDLPALLLSALGILVLQEATPRHAVDPMTPNVRIAGVPDVLRAAEAAAGSSPRVTRGRVYVAALLFVLALYTKQSYVAAPLAALFWLLTQDRVAARRLFLALGVLGLGPLLVLQIATRGAFVFDLFIANVNPFSLSLLTTQVRDFMVTFAVVIVLAVVGVWSSRLKTNSAGDAIVATAASSGRLHLSLLDWYLLTGLATILLAGKVGAWENYFFEALFVLCIYAGLGIERLLRNRQPIAQTLVPLAVIVQLGLMWHDPRIAVRVIDEDGAANRTLAPLIAAQPGMILSEDLGLLLVNGKDVPYFSFQYAQLAHVGRWDQAWETENLRTGRFSLVILEKGTREDPDRYRRFTRQVLSAIDEGYGLVTEVGKYRLYAPQPMLRHIDVPFGEQIALLGYRIDSPLPSDGDITLPPRQANMPNLNPYPSRLRVTLLWQARPTITTNYKVFVHLEDASGQRIAQSDAIPLFNLYPTGRWSADEIVRDYHDLDMPQGLPAGRYVLRVGLYDPQSGRRLQLADGRDSLPLASLPLDLTEPIIPSSAKQQTIRFEDGIALVASQLSGAAINAGMPLTVTLYWQANAFIDRDYTVFVHLADEDNTPLAQDDSQPLAGTYPTPIWNPGELVADAHVLTVPRHLAPGTYRLLVGLYHQPSNRRLALIGGGDSALLAEIQVLAP